MSTEIDEKLEGIARATEERREMAAAELLDLAERLGRLETGRGMPEREAEQAREQKRRLMLGALTGDKDALREVERLEAVEEAAIKRAERLGLAIEHGQERLRGLRGILAETATAREMVADGRAREMLREGADDA